MQPLHKFEKKLVCHIRNSSKYFIQIHYVSSNSKRKDGIGPLGMSVDDFKMSSVFKQPLCVFSMILGCIKTGRG